MCFVDYLSTSICKKKDSFMGNTRWSNKKRTLSDRSTPSPAGNQQNIYKQGKQNRNMATANTTV